MFLQIVAFQNVIGTDRVTRNVKPTTTGATTADANGQ